MRNDCLFCKIAAGEMDTRVVYETDEIIAFRDINPQAPVHILIIPRKHVAAVADLKEEDTRLAGKLVLAAATIAKREQLDREGYRLVFNNGRSAGQEIDHIHLHLLGGRQMHWPPG